MPELASDIAAYGEVFARYTGEGRLLTAEGQFTCAFEAAQLHDGEIVLLCDKVRSEEGRALRFPFPQIERFEGELTEGGRLTAEGNIIQTNALINGVDDDGLSPLAFRARCLRVGWQDTEDLQEVRFGLTNFFVSGTNRKVGEDRIELLPLTLVSPYAIVEAEISTTTQYRQRRRRLMTVGSPLVTAEVGIRRDRLRAVSPGGEPPPLGSFPAGEKGTLDEIVTSLCYVLSVARGTKIQWIYRDVYTRDGQRVERVHFSHVTREYAPYPVIPPKWSAQRQARFIEPAFQAYYQRRGEYRLNATIDAYVQAKSQHDYIETRGLKLAVALEAVKHAYAERRGWEGEYYVGPKKFDELGSTLRAAIRKVLSEGGVDDAAVKEVLSSGNDRGLNRRTFAQIIHGVAEEIGLALDSEEVRAFARSRNTLVHQGRFYSSTVPPAKLAKFPYASPRSEYLYDLYFLDRFFLRLLGYEGEFLDARYPDERRIASVGGPGSAYDESTGSPPQS